MSLHRACCCNPVDLTCRTSGVHSGCVGFSTRASGRFVVCILNETGDNAVLNASTTGLLMTRYAEGQYRYTETGVRKVELDITAPAGAVDDVELRGYSWDSGTSSWTLLRTITSAASLSRVTGYNQYNPVGSVFWRLWSPDKWFPETVTASISGPADCAYPCYSGFYDGDFYYARTTDLTYASTVLSRSSVENFCTPTGCQFYAEGGTISMDQYSDPTDCSDETNLTRSVTLPIMQFVCFSQNRGVTGGAIPGQPWNTDSRIWTHASTLGGGTEFDRAGETIVLTNQTTCDGTEIASGGSLTVTIPAFGT